MIWYLMLNVLYTCREQPQKRNLPNHYLQVAHPLRTGFLAQRQPA